MCKRRTCTSAHVFTFHVHVGCNVDVYAYMHSYINVRSRSVQIWSNMHPYVFVFPTSAHAHAYKYRAVRLYAGQVSKYWNECIEQMRLPRGPIRSMEECLHSYHDYNWVIIEDSLQMFTGTAPTPNNHAILAMRMLMRTEHLPFLASSAFLPCPASCSLRMGSRSSLRKQRCSDGISVLRILKVSGAKIEK